MAKAKAVKSKSRQPRSTKTAPAAKPSSLPVEGRRLLDAVLADVDDDEVRLVFADWLSDRGDPRGEFIHLQCALGRPLVNASGRAWTRPRFAGDPEELEKRERKLLSAHQKEWVAPVRSTIRTWNWSRGFIDRVVADCATYLAGATRLFAEMPVTRVNLTAMKPPMIHALAEQPTSAKIRELDVNFQKLDAAGVVAFRAEVWRGLRWLNLAGNRLGSDGTRSLAGAELPSLRHLELTDAYLSDEAAAGLTGAPFFGRLESLDLGYNRELTSATLRAIAKTGRSLVTLRLHLAEVSDAEIDDAIRALPNLADLDLGRHTHRATAALASRRRG
jgi:uncharacterized protein (TIGR02996 family)